MKNFIIFWLILSLWTVSNNIFRKDTSQMMIEEESLSSSVNVTTSLLHKPPHHFSEVCFLFFFFNLLLWEPQIHRPRAALDGSLEEEKAVQKQNTQTQTRLGMGCNEWWRATESHLSLPLAEMWATSLNLKVSSFLNF